MRELIGRFLAERGDTVVGASHAMASDLRPGLEREIDRRVREAQDAQAPFPASAPAQLLHAAPRYIIALQTPG